MAEVMTVNQLDARDLLKGLRRFRRGDFSVRLPLDLHGVDGEIAQAFNDVVELNQNMEREFRRLGKVVGREGKIQQRGSLSQGRGSWQDCINSVNGLIGDMVQPTTEVARVIGAVAKGDLSQAMNLEIDGRPLRGEFLRIGKVVNTMVGQLSSFASEVTRVAREVGTEGKLGGQARVKGVAGTWKDLTDNVNLMASNLTGQVRNIAEVTTAVAGGDLSKKITVDVKGEILELKNTINTMVDQLNSFASEVTRVAREVGTEGKLGGQARVEGVGGTWKGLTDNVNAMASNLTGQVRNIAEVTTAVARGDLSRKITVDVKGEILELKNTINTMVDQLNSFASEVTRVAREVGTEGKLGGQARVEGVGGTWKDLTDNVNAMATNLTSQVRNIAEVTTAVAKGDLSKQITVDVKGEILELKNTINTMVGQLNSFASEVTRVAREVGTEGKLGGEARVEGVGGTWKDLTDNVNAMATNLTSQVRNIAEVTTAVAKGDLSKQITVDVKGEILELKNTINTMVDQLNSFASEVTRVAREVGTEGKLGGQARVEGVGGTWKDLTDNVNMMATNLTNQVRGIANVVTAVANGDLTRKLAVDAKGEIAALADTINGMIDTLATFADQVTNVAREVGIEGKLGGQARVPGAAGLWRDLTDNVNQLAANLTTQVRAIAEVATAVTEGDLTRSITVEASGEVASLKDTINEMIGNLKDTTQKNNEQDWLKTNLTRFTRMLQGERNLNTVSNLILSEMAPLVNVQHGAFYVVNHTGDNDESQINLLASYAIRPRKDEVSRFKLREGLIGQCAHEKRSIHLTDVPGDYIQISSGLGSAQPHNIVVLPVLFEGQVLAVIELASFTRFSETHVSFLDQLMESIGIVLNTIAANMRTEELLKQSQLLTAELQSQQDELRNTNDRLEQQAASLRKSEEMLRNQREELRHANEDLEEKARLLSLEKRQVEATNREVEKAKAAVEEKAEQLALISKYKSEFLANMSHELRTPLNSLLILSKLLADNTAQNLSDKQVEFAQTIHGAGTDLLNLINDILDLSKIESGTLTLSIEDTTFESVRDHMHRTFDQIAKQKDLTFSIGLDANLPKAMRTDPTRLQQVLMNLLSNAFKFTDDGSVAVRVEYVTEEWDSNGMGAPKGRKMVAFTVADTGIGIREDQQGFVFEAFHQADGTTSRKYAGTGLGLSISREIARRLGGDIRLDSVEGKGSTFTLYVPVDARLQSSNETAAQSLPVTMMAEPDTQNFRCFEFEDDRNVVEGDKLKLLIVEEDDETVARALLDIGRNGEFNVIVAAGRIETIDMARKHRPDLIALHVAQRQAASWVLMDMLKHDPVTQHIPIHVIARKTDIRRSIRMGAFSVSSNAIKPEVVRSALDRARQFVQRPLKRLCVVESPDYSAHDLKELLEDDGLALTSARPGQAAKAVAKQGFDGLVVVLGGSGSTGLDLVERLKPGSRPAPLPIVAFAPDLREPDQEERLRLLAEAGVRSARTKDHLVAEVARALHRPLSSLSPERQRLMSDLRRDDPQLAGRKIAIIDDDIRNIFSLTSVLEQLRMEVIHAEDGRSGIERLSNHMDVDLALVDVMMPEMDGYETMTRMRELDNLKDLPLIAVTAKAMKGDRERCFEAGASDYIAKPVDVDHLLATLRVWLDR